MAVGEAKVAKVRTNPEMTVHWPAAAETNYDSLIVWGTTRVIEDTSGRETLWGQMGYALHVFEPGGPSAPTHGFVAVVPTKAVLLRMYGVRGRESWKA